MAEYIEREKALNICENYYLHCLEMHDFNGDSIADSIKTDIQNLPTADVVEVVRCKDCKYSRPKNKSEKNIYFEDVIICESCEMADEPCAVLTNDYCSYGERKENKKMKSVLMSIQPKWCELIANGTKTVEVRKTKPKLETPFKCYIYCTKAELLTRSNNNGKIYVASSKKYQKSLERNGNITLSGKVIGEFVCKQLTYIGADFDRDGIRHLYNTAFIENRMCIELDELFDYLYPKGGWGWHISNLVIYDKPRELGEFYTLCYSGCDECKYKSFDCSYGGDKDIVCTVSNKKPITRPPQSYCYVESEV